MSKYIASVLDVLIWPDPKLKQVSEEVTTFDESLHNLAADMFITMTALNGVGLSAPQVNHPIRMICLRLEEDKPMVIINPKVTVLDDTPFKWEEGCLSVPSYFKNGKRPSKIAVEFQDIKGEVHNIHFTELYAYAVQHEIDHLNGICFVDKVSRIWHPKIKKKVRIGADDLKKRTAMVRFGIEQKKKEQDEGEE